MSTKSTKTQEKELQLWYSSNLKSVLLQRLSIHYEYLERRFFLVCQPRLKKKNYNFGTATKQPSYLHKQFNLGVYILDVFNENFNKDCVGHSCLKNDFVQSDLNKKPQVSFNFPLELSTFSSWLIEVTFRKNLKLCCLIRK